MNQSKKISLCITTYNRPEFTLRAFQEVVDDPRIDEIIISDDCSLHKNYTKLEYFCKNIPKITVTKNKWNRGVYRNKFHAIDGASNEWCILLDSDNQIGLDYLDTLYAMEKWDKKKVYLPAFAKPTFDYRRFEGRIITKENVGTMLQEPMFDCLLNTMNGFYNREEYAKMWITDEEPGTCDSMYMNYLYLRGGYQLYVVPGLEYIHTVHDGSHFKLNSAKYQHFKAALDNRYKSLQ